MRMHIHAALCWKCVFRLCKCQRLPATACAGDGVCSSKSSLAVQLADQQATIPITKTDEAFAADGLEFVYTHEGIDLDELNNLFGKVGHTLWLRM